MTAESVIKLPLRCVIRLALLNAWSVSYREELKEI